MYKDKEEFKKTFIGRCEMLYGQRLEELSNVERYKALASMVKGEMSKQSIATNDTYQNLKSKQIYYFSMEFLPGRMLESNLVYLGMRDMAEKALLELGIDLKDLIEEEPDPGLGNGGLGRLASCFLDSMASLNLPGHGCGLRYRYGLFEQKIIHGNQMEYPDDWLRNGFDWEFRKLDKAVEVRFGGNVTLEEMPSGDIQIEHKDYQRVLAVPYDVPMPGYQTGMVNTMRLWSAEPIPGAFDYHRTLEDRHDAESLCQVLYPDDTYVEGKQLRLKQQYFLVSAGLQSIIRRYKKKYQTFSQFSNNICLHINDTHPAMIIPELMRILMDDEGMGWDQAWEITSQSVNYTNHTILPEALEKWPLDMFKQILPRIAMIIEEINRRFCQEAYERLKDEAAVHRLAIIADQNVWMANLAVVGSVKVNGVAKIHSNILKQEVMKDFNHYFPDKFVNKTNGVTHRRWLMISNPRLSNLIVNTIGRRWIRNPGQLDQLLYYVDDKAFQDEIGKIKLENKKDLAMHIHKWNDIKVDPESIFDVQIKRIHAYKRQLLNVFHIMYLYNHLKDNPGLDITPRTFIFAGKAAPGYYLAKRIIKLIYALSHVINRDKSIQDKLKVVFLENYNVSMAQKIFPGSDVSEQISTASKEASGTGCMKFMMNGAVTIGTLDGANVEIRDLVGEDNFVLFGLTAEDVFEFYNNGGYNSRSVCAADMRLVRIMEQLTNGHLNEPPEEFLAIYEHLMQHNDEFFVLEDFADYVLAQGQIEECYKDQAKWRKMCIHNIAQSGYFSSDRSIREYASEIWKVRPIKIAKEV
ncbi:MAG: glycogen/starch/alpha-glucan phosphorylase [Peptococcaceae bacterium]|jgi:starch phosphorylase|nr:glycogen/starch/alpha-glucan phosphorylase [Peptococcaceae bacterium]